MLRSCQQYIGSPGDYQHTSVPMDMFTVQTADLGELNINKLVNTGRKYVGLRSRLALTEKVSEVVPLEVQHYVKI